MKTPETPLGSRIRVLAAQYAVTNNKQRAEGLIQAADLVDEHAALLTGKAMVELLGQMMQDRLEGFIADVVVAIRDEEGVPKREVRITERSRKDPPPRNGVRVQATPRAISTAGDMGLGKGERKVLVCLAQHSPAALPADQISALTGYRRSSRDAFVSRLIARGYAVRADGGIAATNAGIKAAGNYEKLPTGDALLAWWLERLPEGERKVLNYVAKFFPHPISRDRISEVTGYKRSSRDAYISRLTSKRLVESPGAGHVVAVPHLFEEGAG